jgi:hypothetical protein
LKERLGPPEGEPMLVVYLPAEDILPVRVGESAESASPADIIKNYAAVTLRLSPEAVDAIKEHHLDKLLLVPYIHIKRFDNEGLDYMANSDMNTVALIAGIEPCDEGADRDHQYFDLAHGDSDYLVTAVPYQRGSWEECWDTVGTPFHPVDWYNREEVVHVKV